MLRLETSIRAGPGEFLFTTLKYISATIYKFDLSEAFLVPIKKKKVTTADASYSVLTKRTKEISAVVEGITCMFHLGVQASSSMDIRGFTKFGIKVA